jgi:hypothetical protein
LLRRGPFAAALRAAQAVARGEGGGFGGFERRVAVVAKRVLEARFVVVREREAQAENTGA